MRAALVLALTLAFATPATATAPLANHCVKIGSHGRFYLKPTRLGGFYMLLDTHGRLRGAGAPGAAAEWARKRGGAGGFAGASRLTGRSLGKHLRFTRAKGCRRFPEAAVDASGKA